MFIKIKVETQKNLDTKMFQEIISKRQSMSHNCETGSSDSLKWKCDKGYGNKDKGRAI